MIFELVKDILKATLLKTIVFYLMAEFQSSFLDSVKEFFLVQLLAAVVIHCAEDPGKSSI